MSKAEIIVTAEKMISSEIPYEEAVQFINEGAKIILALYGDKLGIEYSDNSFAVLPLGFHNILTRYLAAKYIVFTDIKQYHELIDRFFADIKRTAKEYGRV
jgi:hypothetical protein